MSKEPRDPGLAAIFQATVRVADGSGVVIRNGGTVLVATAAHVVRDGEIHPVRKGGVFGECRVISRNGDLDVALITPPRELEANALDVADYASDALPGDRIWGAGFPRGWKGSDPVVAPGTVAGIGEQSWVNLDGTWGNSGGPLCRIQHGKALVAGILLGNASDPSETMTDWLERTKRMEVEADEIMVELRRYVPPKKKVPELAMTELVKTLALQHSRLLVSQTLSNSIVADLIDEHFRTGFLRFAPVTDLRKLLGTGDGRPSL